MAQLRPRPKRKIKNKTKKPWVDNNRGVVLPSTHDHAGCMIWDVDFAVCRECEQSWIFDKVKGWIPQRKTVDREV